MCRKRERSRADGIRFSRRRARRLCGMISARFMIGNSLRYGQELPEGASEI